MYFFLQEERFEKEPIRLDELLAKITTRNNRSSIIVAIQDSGLQNDVPGFASARILAFFVSGYYLFF